MNVKALRSRKEGALIPGAWNAFSSYPPPTPNAPNPQTPCPSWNPAQRDPWFFFWESSSASPSQSWSRTQSLLCLCRWGLHLSENVCHTQSSWVRAFCQSVVFLTRRWVLGGQSLELPIPAHGWCSIPRVEWVYELIGPKKRTTSSVQIRNTQTLNSKGQGPCPGSLPSLDILCKFIHPQFGPQLPAQLLLQSCWELQWMLEGRRLGGVRDKMGCWITSHSGRESHFQVETLLTVSVKMTSRAMAVLPIYCVASPCSPRTESTGGTSDPRNRVSPGLSEIETNMICPWVPFRLNFSFSNMASHFLSLEFPFLLRLSGHSELNLVFNCVLPPPCPPFLGHSARGLWDLSSLTRDRTLALGSESAEFYHWTSREFPF